MTRKIPGLVIGLFMLLVTALAAQDVQVVQTTPDLRQALQTQKPVRFGTTGRSPLVIQVDDATQYQEIDGFGASLTDSSGWLLYTKLNAAQRQGVIRDLFDPIFGIGLSFIRQPMGASDLALHHYSYDDLPAGQKDPELNHFSIQHDEAYILPLLRAARAINPQLKVMATPWSPPGWMKTTRSLVGGSVLPEFYPALANYFVRFVQAYESAGVPIYAVTMQNEPLFVPKDYPGSEMPAGAQTTFLRDHLGPAFREAGVNAKVLVYDHNWDHAEYPAKVLGDPVAAKFAAGTAFHCYGGDVAAQGEIHDRFPEKDLWETECSGGTWQSGNALVTEAQLIVGAARNWARSVVLWNMALDQNHGPNAGGCDTCRGVVTVNTASPVSVTRTLDYYVLGHVSKYVRPGARRIGSTSFDAKLENVAFQNPDGSIALFAVNPGADPANLAVSYHGQSFAYTLPAGSVATFAWSTAPAASHNHKARRR
ncbi:MAG: Glucosylceramidase [Candidatus Angelobacter sp.]|nr:Glucosylceramidase [Candidatus Angelobacter sp.]